MNQTNPIGPIGPIGPTESSDSSAPELGEAALEAIREHLFFTSSEYTKSFPDFGVPQRFEPVAPSGAAAVLEQVRDSLVDEGEVLLYAHLPFCAKECVFCNTDPRQANGREQDLYLDAMLKQLGALDELGLFEGHPVRSVYFGGGTPTAFTPAQLGRLLDAIRGSTTFAEGCRVTCEAHPHTLAANERIAELAALGIDRISLGVQSFDLGVQALIHRKNPLHEVAAVLERARAADLEVNLDLMVGLPGQTVASVERDLELMDQLQPDAVEVMRHEVVNPLAIALYSRRPELQTEPEDLWTMMLLTQRWMMARGYEQNGHFTTDRFFPHRFHWLRELPILGLGARARSYTPHFCADNHTDPRLYRKLVDRGQAPIARVLALTDRDRMFRALFLGLQLAPGIDAADFARRFGVSLDDAFGPVLAPLAEWGCLVRDDAGARLTVEGRAFVEDVCCYLIDQAMREAGAEPVRVPHTASRIASGVTMQRSRA